MILEDAREFSAVASRAFLLDSRTFLGRAQLKSGAQDVKTYTTQGPSIKVVSFVV